MRGRFRPASVLCSGILSVVPSVLITSRSHCEKSPEIKLPTKKEQEHDVAVYLTQSSRDELSAYLRKLGVEAEVDTKSVVIRRSCSSRDSYFYEPLFGERSAFRLKGLIKTDSGAIAGVGRVSTLTGELIDDDCDPSIALKLAPVSSSGKNHAIDLPTRLSEMGVTVTSDWKGEITSGSVLQKQYPADNAEYIAIPSEKQLVVQGVLCSSLYIDDEGKCTFDRAVDMQQFDAPLPTDEELAYNARKQKRRIQSKANDPPKGPIDEKECPVCRYMKGGPCKSEFEGWEACVETLGDSDDLTKCFDVTMEMMKCMRANEYYDIMTAGTEEKYAAAENAATAAPAAAEEKISA